MAELDRKFVEALPEPNGVRGEWVQSPIDQNKAAKNERPPLALRDGALSG